MITRETAFDAANPKESDSTRDALNRMHDDINALRLADRTVGSEMNKIKVVCEPPPITPPCHGEDQPADPKVVSMAMVNLNTAEQKLEAEIDALRPRAHAEGAKFEQDFMHFSSQVVNQPAKMDTLKTAIDSLNKLTNLPEYNRDDILSVTQHIETLAKNAEKTRKQLEKDLH